jgi:RNA polymerase sigma factor FliA
MGIEDGMVEELIENHLGYAHAIAAEFLSRYPPNITRDDLESAAELGLVQAAHRYDPLKCVSFPTFAYYRVRGAIFDEVRKSWHASHANIGRDSSTSEEPSDREKRLRADGFDEDHSQSGEMSFVSLDSTLPERLLSSDESPSSLLLKKEQAAVVRKAISRLPQRHRFVLQSYYYDELSLVGISKQLSLSKSRVSRLHAQAIAMIRQALERSSQSLSLARRPVMRKAK